MRAFEYAAAMERVKAMPDGRARYEAWRAAKSARQLYLHRKRRERDPAWYRRKLDKEAEYRRTRAANDPEYRELRNRQGR